MFASKAHRGLRLAIGTFSMWLRWMAVAGKQPRPVKQASFG